MHSKYRWKYALFIAASVPKALLAFLLNGYSPVPPLGSLSREQEAQKEDPNKVMFQCLRFEAASSKDCHTYPTAVASVLLLPTEPTALFIHCKQRDDLVKTVIQYIS